MPFIFNFFYGRVLLEINHILNSKSEVKVLKLIRAFDAASIVMHFNFIYLCFQMKLVCK